MKSFFYILQNERESRQRPPLMMSSYGFEEKLSNNGENVSTPLTTGGSGGRLLFERKGRRGAGASAGAEATAGAAAAESAVLMNIYENPVLNRRLTSARGSNFVYAAKEEAAAAAARFLAVLLQTRWVLARQLL